jgi:hypothetical protein
MLKSPLPLTLLVTIKITISLFVILSSSWLKMTYCCLDVKRQSFNYTVRYITNTNNVINIIIIILILTTTAQNDTLHLYIVWKLNSWKSTLKINKLQLRSFPNVFQNHINQTPLSVTHFVHDNYPWHSYIKFRLQSYKLVVLFKYET